MTNVYLIYARMLIASLLSMRKAHAHIRNGERNLLVAAPNSVNIIGVVKRHDIMPGTLDATLLVKRRQELKEQALQDDAVRVLVDGTSRTLWGNVELSNVESGKEVNPVLADLDFSNIKLDPFEPRFYELLHEYIEAKHKRHNGQEDKEKLYDITQKPRRNDFRKMRTYRA